MKNYYNFFLSIIVLLSIGATNTLQAQTPMPPYNVSPKWMFGWGSGLDFTLGTPPSIILGNPSTGGNAPQLENSTSICEPSKNLALYTNTVLVYNGATNGTVRNMNTADAIAANSSTGGAIAFPNPASPTNQFYLFIANDITGGAIQGNQGINYYLFSKAGTTVSYISGPHNLTTGAEVDESIAVSSDGDGNYWVAAHATGASELWVWRVTTGGVSAVDKQPIALNAGSNGAIKFNRCQSRIAILGNGRLMVYGWNRQTGKIITPVTLNIASSGINYGLEFSPDGNYVYYTSLAGPELRQANVSTGVVTVLSTASSNSGTGVNEIGSMQLAPDNKIYVSNPDRDGFTTTTYIGVINNPNGDGAGAGNASYSSTGFTLQPGGAANPSIYRGIVNLAWTNPNRPDFTATTPGANPCERNLTHLFQTYFLDNITPDPTSFTWDFNDGTADEISNAQSPTHVFPDGTWNVSLTFRDQACGHTWTRMKSVTINCPMPVDWLDIDAVYNNGAVDVTWSTATEIDNDYFEVQRSIDGINFVTIGTVNSKGNSNRIQEYSFTDLSPIAGGSYYRIVQHDIDGKFTNSPNAFVNIASVIVNVSPNPSSSDFDLTVSGASSAVVIVTDVLGRVVYQTELSGNVITTSFGAELIEGTYSLQVITDGNSYTEKIVKK